MAMGLNADHEPSQIHEQSLKIDWNALRIQSLRPGGFGTNRRHIWPKLLNVKVPSSASVPLDDSSQAVGSEEGGKEGIRKDPSDTEVPSSDSAREHKDEYQIQLDTDRSFVLYPDDSKTRIPKSKLKLDLNRLIVSIFHKRPKLNYFQGYHDIMTVVYLTLPRELQFSCAEKLSLHRLRDSMLHSLEPVLGLLRVLKNLLRLVDPEFAELLERDSPLPFYALSNLLTLFAHDMPTLPLVQHVFDYLFCRSPIAVVYLAAAMLLVKKDYIKTLEDQLEPFMLHPILSCLPPLTEGFESMERKPPNDQSLWKAENTSSLHDIKQESDDEPAPQHEQNTFQSTSTGPESYTGSEHTEAPSVDDVAVVKQEPSYASCAPDNGSEPSRPLTPDQTRLLLPDSDTTLPTSPQPASLRPPLSPIKTEPDVDPESTAEASLSSSPTSNLPVPPIPPISLPTILSHADVIYAQYPPSHPSLKLSSIMGPQSVMFTWSENFADLPSDATAEAMVGRPELVVYPVSPEEKEGSGEEGEEGGGDRESDSDSEYDNEKKREKRMESGSKKSKSGKEGDVKRRTRRKTIRKKVRKILNNVFGTGGAAARAGVEASVTHVDGRTMVAGAVLVLGVAMAVYGIKARGGGGIGGLRGEVSAVEDSLGMGLGAGLQMLGDHHPLGHRHGYLYDELKKVVTVLVDVGANFLNLGDHGLRGGKIVTDSHRK